MDGSMPRTHDTPRDRLKALPPERQAVMLDPAEAEFAEKGFQGASLNAILTAAGMSKGQAYYYIADKAELYRAVIERALARLSAKAAPATFAPETAEAFWDEIGAIFARISAALSQDERLAELARRIYDGPAEMAALEAPLSDLRQHMERAISTGQALGAIRTDIPRSLLSDMLFAAARAQDHWFAAHWTDLSPEEALWLNRQGLDMLRAMAAPREMD